MPGSTGTGHPITFKCPKCIRQFGWRSGPRRGYNYEVTGKVRPLTTAQQGYGGLRVVRFRVQFKCLDCGHVGWSRHRDVACKLQQRFQVSGPLMAGLPRISREITIGVGDKPSKSEGLGKRPEIPENGRRVGM